MVFTIFYLPDLIPTYSPIDTPEIPWEAIGVGFLASLITTLLASLIPAVIASRVSIAQELRSFARSHKTVSLAIGLRKKKTRMKIANKTFVVTGSGNGIGRETTLQLLQQGAKVAGFDLSEDGLKGTAKLAQAGERFSTHIVDITKLDAVKKAHDAVLKQHGQIDGLLNIAGIIQKFVPVNDLSIEEIEKVITVNLYGVINTVKIFLPTLIARPEACLINVSSMGAYTPVPGQSVYGATKAAVQALTNGLHSELMKTNVHVSTVFPGAIGTNIAQNSGVMSDADAANAETGPDIKMTSPEEAGQVMVKTVQKNPYYAFIGSDAKMLNRLSRLAPKKTAGMVAKRMASLLD